MAAQDELVLLERVFLRIGSAETDEQLQVSLSKFLAPCLLKLSSQQDGVRKKVMELLVHINKRVKSRPEIQLPVDALLVQFQDPSASPFVTNFTILYIKLGFPRLDIEKQADLAPTVISCMDGKPRPQQESLLLLLIPVLAHLTMPSEKDQRLAKFGLSDKPAVTKMLLEFMHDYLLLPYSCHSGQAKPAPPAPPSAPGAPGAPGVAGRPAAAPPAITAPPPVGHPGLSELAFKRVTGDNPPAPEKLEEFKVGIIKFLGSDIFKEHEVAIHFIIGQSDTRHSVATVADMELKRLSGTVDWDDPLIISKLYSLFQGTNVIKGQEAKIKKGEQRAPANIRIRNKIFPFFLRSKQSADIFPQCLQVIFDCLYGSNTNHKLKVMAVQMVHHVCLNCSDAKFKPIGPVLMTGMVKLIREAEDAKLRGQGYVAIGKIAKRSPQLITKDIALLQTFFDAMSKEESETMLAVQEAMSMMAQAFKGLEGTNLMLMEALVMQNIEKDEPQARLMSVQYASAVFPADHIPSRYVLLLACGDMKEDVYTEASKALRKVLKSNTEENEAEDMDNRQQTLLPDFPKLVAYIQDKANERLNTQKKFLIGSHVLPFNPGTYAEIVMYLRMCLAYNAGVVPRLESTQAMQEQAPVIAKYVKQLLQQQSHKGKGPVQTYIELIKNLLSAIGGAPAMYCLLELAAGDATSVAPLFSKKVDWIKGFMFSSKEDMRMYSAELFAVVMSGHADEDKCAQVVKELTRNVKEKVLEAQHGSLLALGYLIAKLLSKRGSKLGDLAVEDMETDAVTVTASSGSGTDHFTSAATGAIKEMARLLDHQQSLLCSGACVALGEIGRNASLPLPNESDNKNEVTKLSIVDKLIKKVHSSSESHKFREKAALCLGYLCVGEPNFPYCKKAIVGLLDCAQAKQLELHFTVGDALLCAAQGPTNAVARDFWTVPENEFQASIQGTSDDIGHLLDLLLTKYSVSTNPHIRQAACVWLLSLVKKCGSHPAIQAKLKETQEAFMSQLTEKDEITQDLAGKGLGLVYDISGKEQKDELVSILVQTLTGARKTKRIQVTAETKVFEEGAIGTAPDGSNLSTYKELCSIATDLNQPDLVYKFMHLANHNAIWNSKKGAAFGFTSIAAQAGEQLAPFLSKIVPKLYRYQFDPNPRIQSAMSSIWGALVKDTKKTVDEYLREILDDLIRNLISPLWRVRESSCMAVQDVLRGRQLENCLDTLPQLWETLFRVRDDIKETVRKAAEQALKSLSRLSIKMCDVNNGKVGEQAISLVLPSLLKAGLGSQVQEVREVGLNTIVKISKNAGHLLKPIIPQLVTALLEALSGLEPQVLNYISLQYTNSQLAQDRLDSARLAAFKSSPMMETVNLCVQYIDQPILAELVPRLVDLIKSGIGLGTKAGCSHLVVSLCHQCPRELTPFASKLNNALMHGLVDRSSAVRKSYASAMGHLVKIAKDSSVEKVIKKLRLWYFEKEDESVRQACGHVLLSMAQQSPDAFKRHAAVALPLAFLAMHEKKEKRVGYTEEQMSVWEEVWNDTTPGTEGGIRLYLTELVEITQTALDSQSWFMKAQGAAAMSKVATKLGRTLGPPQLGMLLTGLLKGMVGRTWSGKEALLHAVSSVGVSCKDELCVERDGQPSMQKVTDALMKECKKEKIEYKKEALMAIAPVLEAHELDRFQELYDLLFPLLDKRRKVKKVATEGGEVQGQEGKGEGEGEGEKKEGEEEEEEEHDPFEDVDQDTRIEFECCAFECLGKSWPSNVETQNKLQEDLCRLLVVALGNSMWKVQLELLKSMQVYLKRLVILKDKESLEANLDVARNLVQLILPPVTQLLGNLKYSTIRIEAMNITEWMINKLAGYEQMALVEVGDLLELDETLAPMYSDSVPDLQDKAKDLQKLLVQYIPAAPPSPTPPEESDMEIEQDTPQA